MSSSSAEAEGMKEAATGAESLVNHCQYNVLELPSPKTNKSI